MDYKGVIAIDCDGVLVEEIGQDWFDWLKRNFKFKKEWNHLVTETYKTVKLPYNLATLFETSNFNTGFEFWNDQFLYENYVPLKTTQQYIDMLHIKGYNIVVASKVIGDHYKSKEIYIKKFFPYASIVFTEHKYLLRTDWIIDDTYAVLNSMPESVKVIKYRNDYIDQNANMRSNCMSAYSFSDVYNLIVGD